MIATTIDVRSEVGVTAMHSASIASLRATPAVTAFERINGMMSFGKIEVDKGTSPYCEDFTQVPILTVMCLNNHVSKGETSYAG